MARSWKDVRAQAVEAGLIDEARVGELRAKLRAEVRAHRLAEIRQANGLDQSALAERLGVFRSRGFPGSSGVSWTGRRSPRSAAMLRRSAVRSRSWRSSATNASRSGERRLRDDCERAAEA